MRNFSKKIGNPMGIYCIVNTINGKKYIGSSEKMRGRYWGHKGKLQNNRHENDHLQQAWNKYGGNVFIFLMLEVVENEKLLTETEQFYMDLYKTVDRRFGYNIVERAGDRSAVSQETREKLSRAAKGRRHSPETVAKIKANIPRGKDHMWYGKKASKEERQKMSERAKISCTTRGKSMSEEVKLKISNKLKGKSKPPTSQRAIVQLSIDGQILQRFESFNDVISRYGSMWSIKMACENPGRIFKGFRYTYAYSRVSDITRKRKSNVEQFRPVVRLSLDGEILEQFLSVSEAGRQYGNRSCVSQCCNNTKREYAGFKWAYATSEISLTQIKHKQVKARIVQKSIPVVKLSLDGEILERFSSQAEAARNTSSFITNIDRACKNVRNTAKGFKWAYATSEVQLDV